MAHRGPIIATFCVASLLPGCAAFDFAGGLWPTFDDPPPAQQIAIGPGEAELARSPLIDPPVPAVAGAPRVAAIDTTPTPEFPATGTFVGQKVTTLRSELEGLKAQIRQQNAAFQEVVNNAATHSQRYHATVGAIAARLQVGTTPGNPVLVSQWNAAQSELDRVVAETAALNALANQISASSDLATYLLQATRAAYGLQGAVDEDHRQLALLEDDVNRTVVSIDRLLNQINEMVTRQNIYEAGERRNLSSLARAISAGEIYGPSLANLAYGPSARLTPYTPPAPGMATPSRAAAPGREAPPLVVIRFDRPDVQYQQALYNAVSQALEQRPGSSFDLVAVAPSTGTVSEIATNASKARRDAERVMKTLVDMGLPAARVELSSAESPTAATNEVHIYLR